MTYDREKFYHEFGVLPVQDDLSRVNCDAVGNTGHQHCGVCLVHNKPRLQCGCIAINMTPDEYVQYNLNKEK